ncbi:MAG: FtsX-like permease family protein [Rhodoferax sp.]|nr:FtsX-like permease family protein [Rhodoferax sp.]MBP9927816.1 FtsX-like permease family protein [Rhodoferax sp.]HQZ04618.1 ABC transporter permease [Burkholderiaceae bacterium]
MKALDRKLLRDLRLMWSQVLTIALVVASGIGGFLITLSAVDSLELARDRFYASGQFADVFASVKRAPDSLAPTLRDLPGIVDVQTSTEVVVRVEIEGNTDPIIGQLIGVDARSPRRMNLLTVRGKPAGDSQLSPGRARSDGALPVWISETFVVAHGLKPGDRLSALINGKYRALVMTGVALSPEYIFAAMGGMPDQRGFGVFWLDQEALAAAYDMDGAFNRVAVKLAPGANERTVIDVLQNQLARYGGREAFGRGQQTSNMMLNDEIKGQHVLGTVLPSIFLGVAAFLLNIVVSRLVATQREQIAAIKALGYPNLVIAGHYLKMVMVIVAIGFALGLTLGHIVGGMLTDLYAEFFRFPEFSHRMAPWLVASSLLLTVATAVIGTLNAIGATVRLAPAEAMRPPAPGNYRRTLLERLGITGISTAARMILRNMERSPWRSALSIGGVAAAVAIVIMGNFFRDAIDSIVETQFTLAMRNDISVWTQEVVPAAALRELQRLPGVRRVEASRSVPVTLVNGHRRERSQIQGRDETVLLSRIIDLHQHAHPISGDGLVLTDRLARKLGVRVGDSLQVEVLEGRTRTLHLVVEATVSEMMGLNAYMRRAALNRALGDGDLANGFALSLVPGHEDAVLAATRRMPLVAAAFSKSTTLRNMQEISARNIRIMSTVLTVFASVIAIGVVYNNARIALAERTWELASLRVLGFSRAEVSGLLLGEMAISIALALPLGMALGLGLVHLIAVLLQSDQFHFPVVVSAHTYAWAGICVVAAGLASALVVRRRIDRLDMVAALKTRE